MSDERPPGFPPPRGLEGYREAATPALDAPAPSGPHEEHHRVVATLAREPDDVLVPSVHPERVRDDEKPPAMPRVFVAFVMLLIVLVSAVLIARLVRPSEPIHPATPPKGSATKSVGSRTSTMRSLHIGRPRHVETSHRIGARIAPNAHS